MAYQGMRGSENWGTDVRPKNWRQQILRLFPNGSAQLTAMLSMMRAQPVDDPEFNWWTQTFQNQSGSLTSTGVFEDAAFASAYTEGTDAQPAAGDIFYAKAPAALAQQARVGHTCWLEKDGDYRYRTAGRIVHIDVNGANSAIGIKLLEASSDTYDIDEVNRLTLGAGAAPEGAERPNAVAQDPVKYYNYTQIMRTPLNITNTNKATRLRTGIGYQEKKRDCLDYHSTEIEKNILYGVRSIVTSAENGQPLRTMDGVTTILTRENDANSHGNVEAFSHAAPYTTSDWLGTGQGTATNPNGMKWLNKKLEIIMRYGRPHKVGFCGSGALLGIQELAMAGGHINITPTTTEFGIQVLRWITPFGIVDLRTHPLMTQNPQWRNDLIILEPDSVVWRPLVGNGENRDTKYIDAPEKGSNRGVDATQEEYLTEASIELHHPLKHGYLSRVGLNHDDTIETS